jgi:hypothetical protein
MADLLPVDESRSVQLQIDPTRWRSAILLFGCLAAKKTAVLALLQREGGATLDEFMIAKTEAFTRRCRCGVARPAVKGFT